MNQLIKYVNPLTRILVVIAKVVQRDHWQRQIGKVLCGMRRLLVPGRRALSARPAVTPRAATSPFPSAPTQLSHA
jgi:hypothetical protein